MALIVFTSTSSPSPFLLSPSSASSQITSAITANPSVCRLLHKELRGLQPKAFNGLHMRNVPNSTRTQVIVKASAAAGVDGVEPEGGSQPPPPPAADGVAVEDLPLESKQQMILDQRLKMKLAKKLRLRRKRLVRKRHLRKKGRWPPSKMKKNKNV